MGLKEQLSNDLKDAMRNKDRMKKNVITMVRSDIKQLEVDKRADVLDEDIIDIITKQVKQRKDALEEFEKAQRQEAIEETKEEIHILSTYLPEQLSKDEVEDIVKGAIKETNASSMKDMGKVMAAVMPKVKGKADGKIVNEVVKECLQS